MNPGLTGLSELALNLISQTDQILERNLIIIWNEELGLVSGKTVVDISESAIHMERDYVNAEENHIERGDGEVGEDCQEGSYKSVAMLNIAVIKKKGIRDPGVVIFDDNLSTLSEHHEQLDNENQKEV